MQSDSATQCSEANGANEVTNFKRQFAVASTTKKCKQRVDEIRGKWKVFCPIPFPCAFSFLILQYALRFPGGGARQKKENGAASNRKWCCLKSRPPFLFSTPPALWETLCGPCPRRWRHCDVYAYAMSATVMWRVMLQYPPTFYP